MKKSIVIIIQIGLLSHFPTYFTTFMLLSPQWLIQSDGTIRGLINQQLKDSQTLDYNVDVLDEATLGLLILATVFLWIQGIIFTAVECMLLRKSAPSGLCYKIFIKCVYVSIGLYIIARKILKFDNIEVRHLGVFQCRQGFVMLAACVRFATLFPMKKIGYAFYHNMAIFCFIWLVVLIFICDHICKRRRDENVFHTLVCGLREYNDDFTLL